MREGVDERINIRSKNQANTCDASYTIFGFRLALLSLDEELWGVLCLLPWAMSDPFI
jgi:hypothetical protein